MESGSKRRMTKEESKKLLEKMFPKVYKIETFYYDKNNNAIDEEHAKTFVTKRYDIDGKIIDESFGYVEEEIINNKSR